MTTILGIGHALHDSGAALIQRGKPIIAINESRLSRVKRESRFPASSINHIIESADREIDQIAVTGATNPSRHSIQAAFRYGDTFRGRLENSLTTSYRGFQEPGRFLDEITANISRYTELDKANIRDRLEYVDHHRAHAASAYYTSGFDKATVITIDGSGDGVSSAVYKGNHGDLSRVHANADVDSIGYLWAEIPTLFGFKGSKHAGKFMGMAAYVDEVPEEVREVLRWMITVDGLDIINRFEREHYTDDFESTVLALKDHLGEFDPPVVSRALQERTEEVASRFAANAIEATGNSSVALAGGVFANVKLNQRIFELPQTGRIFIHPDMGDGGLGVGAALELWARNEDVDVPERLSDVYLGPAFSKSAVETAIERERLPGGYSSETYDDETKLAEAAADILVSGGVVSHYHGRLEYGPRALGNRSILYQPTDPDAIGWLNKRLSRTEFMPFAPVTLKEYAEDCYYGYDANSCPAADFMTITFDCKPEMKQRSPGVVHVDGTARPQLIDEETNPQYYRILREYHRRTGIPTLINTSFNMHGEPIVCNPADAIESFIRTGNEALIMENSLIRKE